MAHRKPSGSMRQARARETYRRAMKKKQGAIDTRKKASRKPKGKGKEGKKK